MLKTFYTSCMLRFSKSWLAGAYAGQGVLFILESCFRELTVIWLQIETFVTYEGRIPVDLLDRMVIIRT
ncbi:hypothetical protein ERO13_D03G094350v2 [Gossypium hirsutum]|uniref:Uncharacterized protein n=4 Tax=Gossypium TaxID=3633 RepID=A0A0D2QI76_GOSRA|nr:hypothetical protein ES319_D03G113400v1 [Gossypium barbadense]KAG4155145.1 hypothetical protein ERO13_D03G094350v2 [Gossypium hirsutum]KJB19374.1 hypothetical protein B456_003G098500 [Gossypium raimondii]TYG76551.1 hypothetical protein ES288_D03G123000v1 [Gossypium darwinii]TYH80240.1 hypothetical protein ES332_D03G119200v1 [Gossypium tomentosum]